MGSLQARYTHADRYCDQATMYMQTEGSLTRLQQISVKASGSNMDHKHVHPSVSMNETSPMHQEIRCKLVVEGDKQMSW